MRKRLPILCPQEYDGAKMLAVSCTRCTVGWNGRSCSIDTGAEHLSDAAVIPDCPIQDRCQHQIQEARPCIVRRKGFVCESAFVVAGLSEIEAFEHPLAFNAQLMS